MARAELQSEVAARTLDCLDRHPETDSYAQRCAKQQARDQPRCRRRDYEHRKRDDHVQQPQIRDTPNRCEENPAVNISKEPEWRRTEHLERPRQVRKATFTKQH